MRVRARARQKGVELPLVISDHCDWDDLCRSIIETGAEEVWVTHGQEDALVHWCLSRGIRARPLHLLGYGDEEGDTDIIPGDAEGGAPAPVTGRDDAGEPPSPWRGGSAAEGRRGERRDESASDARPLAASSRARPAGGAPPTPGPSPRGGGER
jgi:putative mRNA 3-end processing factor